MNQRRTKERPKNSQTQKVRFIKITVSFPSLIPCLSSPTDDRENSDRTPTPLPANKKCRFLRLLPNKVVLIPKKVDSFPKTVDYIPKIVAYPPNKKSPQNCIFLAQSKIIHYLCSQRSINYIYTADDMSKVTYLLGAGASYGSRGRLPLALQPPISSDAQEPQEGIMRGLPILQEFASAIEQLLVELMNDQFSAEIKYLSSNVLSPLLNVSKNYPTIDTYAKLLYSTRREDEYAQFKNQLSLFFLIWQRMHKQDLRYDSFISSLVDADTCQLPELTILSWNYDVQMEIAYEGYIANANLWKIWEALNVYCKTNSYFPFDINKPFAFIKLNGSAMFHSSNRNEWTLRYDLKDTFQIKDETQLSTIICSICFIT